MKYNKGISRDCTPTDGSEVSSHILGVGWYASTFPKFCESFEAKKSRAKHRWLWAIAEKSVLFKEMVLFVYSWNYDLVVVPWTNRGRWLLVLLEVLFRKNRLVILEFIPLAVNGNPTRKLIIRVRDTCIIKPLLSKAVRLVHVLSKKEIELYRKRYQLERNQLLLTTWPLRRKDDKEPSFNCGVAGKRVVASGKVFCDWNTLFEAACGSTWELIVVCTKWEYPILLPDTEKLGVQLLCNITLDEHQALLASAAVYVISVDNVDFSVAQIRVMNAIRSGVPIVATKVSSLEEYLEHNVTALFVAPGKPTEMRLAIDSLLDRPELGERLAREAWRRSENRTFETYGETLQRAVHELLN